MIRAKFELKKTQRDRNEVACITNLRCNHTGQYTVELHRLDAVVAALIHRGAKMHKLAFLKLVIFGTTKLI